MCRAFGIGPSDGLVTSLPRPRAFAWGCSSDLVGNRLADWMGLIFKFSTAPSGARCMGLFLGFCRRPPGGLHGVNFQVSPSSPQSTLHGVVPWISPKSGEDCLGLIFRFCATPSPRVPGRLRTHDAPLRPARTQRRCAPATPVAMLSPAGALGFDLTHTSCSWVPGRHTSSESPTGFRATHGKTARDHTDVWAARARSGLLKQCRVL